MKAAEYHQQAVSAMTEAELAEQIRQYARTLGMLRFHTYDSRRSEAGFPDEVLVGNRRVLFRELKRQGKNPTPAQQQWITRMEAAGLDVDVWRPEDLLSGRILREMKGAA